jgi:hypothetical protein
MVALKWTDSPAAWVGVAFLAGLVGVLGGVWFSSADVITNENDTTNTGKVTAGQTIGLLLQTYFVPLGLALWMMAAPELVKQPMPPGPKLLVLASAEAFFVAGAAYEWNANAWQLLNCGIVFCIWESVDDDGYSSHSKKPYLYVTATLYVIGCVYFFALLLPATLRAAALAWGSGSGALWNYDASREVAADVERSPLLGFKGSSLDAAALAEEKGAAMAQAWAADYAVAQDRRLSRQRGCLCCALGVLFPACFIVSTVLPDTWCVPLRLQLLQLLLIFLRRLRLRLRVRIVCVRLSPRPYIHQCGSHPPVLLCGQSGTATTGKASRRRRRRPIRTTACTPGPS